MSHCFQNFLNKHFKMSVQMVFTNIKNGMYKHKKYSFTHKKLLTFCTIKHSLKNKVEVGINQNTRKKCHALKLLLITISCVDKITPVRTVISRNSINIQKMSSNKLSTMPMCACILYMNQKILPCKDERMGHQFSIFPLAVK